MKSTIDPEVKKIINETIDKAVKKATQAIMEANEQAEEHQRNYFKDTEKLFRAWYPEKSKMYEVAKVDMWGDPDQATCDLASTGEELFDIYLNEVETLQYIGVKDKYGREICEGDIIQTYFSFAPGDAGYGVPQKPFVVKWEQGRSGFRAYKPNTNDWHLLDTIDFFEMQSELYEIIGNIFENPELLG